MIRLGQNRLEELSYAKLLRHLARWTVTGTTPQKQPFSRRCALFDLLNHGGPWYIFRATPAHKGIIDINIDDHLKTLTSGRSDINVPGIPEKSPRGNSRTDLVLTSPTRTNQLFLNSLINIGMFGEGVVLEIEGVEDSGPISPADIGPEPSNHNDGFVSVSYQKE